MKPNKACPVLLRRRGAVLEVLAFEHPEAGCQLVKGTIEPGESPRAAALRELREESGIDRATVEADLGSWDAEFDNQIWSFHRCATPGLLPDQWVHHAADDGGHDFRFFWQLLDEVPASGWHHVHKRALLWLRRALGDALPPLPAERSAGLPSL